MTGKILALVVIVYIIGFILGGTYEGTWALENSTVTGTLTNESGVATGSPVTLVEGANTITVTGLGTFMIDLPTGGVVGTATSVAPCLVTGSPARLIGGSQTILTTGVAGTIIVDIGAWIKGDEAPTNTIGYLFNLRNCYQIVAVLGIIPVPLPNFKWFEAWFRAATFQWSFLIPDYQLAWYCFFLPFAVIGIASLVTLFVGILQGNISWS